MIVTNRFLMMAVLTTVNAFLTVQAAPADRPVGTYVGSAKCEDCHAAIYGRWTKTRMANVVTDPKLHPEVILPDLAKGDPLLSFQKEEISLVYGTKW